MKFIIDKIIYVADTKKPMIEISWSIISDDGIKRPFLDEAIKWSFFPKILSTKTLQKIKPLSYSSEEDTFFAIRRHPCSAALKTLVKENLEIVFGKTVNALGLLTTARYGKLKQNIPSKSIKKDQIHTLYPFSKVLYMENDGNFHSIALFKICENGIINLSPELIPSSSLDSKLLPTTSSISTQKALTFFPSHPSLDLSKNQESQSQAPITHSPHN